MTQIARQTEGERPELSLAQPSQAPTRQNDEESIDLRRWVNGIFKRWWILLIAAVVCTTATTGWALRLPKLYRTHSTVLIERSTPNVLSNVDEVVPVGGGGGWWAGQDFYAHEYLVIRSRAIAGRAAEILGVEFFGTELPEDRSKLLYQKYSLVPDKNAPGVVGIEVINTDPVYATKVSNAIAHAYEELNLETRVQGTKDAGTWLSLQHRDLKTKLEASEDALYSFMEEKDVLNASLDTQLVEVQQRLNEFNTQLAGVQAARIRARVNSAALADAKINTEMIDTLAEIQGAELISRLKTRLTDLRSAKSQLTGKYQEKHPSMVAIAQQITNLEAELKREIGSKITALEREQLSMAESERGLRAAVADERTREARLNRLSLDFRRLQREVNTNERMFALVTGRMKEADLSGAMRFNNVRILDEARVPVAPFKPSVQRYIMIGLLVGLFLGVIIALALEILDNTIKSHVDIEQLLGLPFLGLVPIITADDGRVRDTYLMEHPKSQAAECVRFIRTNLMFMASEHRLQTMTVTSAMPQDGKTTTATSLAITMAQAGGRTLLVDTDMRRPRIHRIFGLTNERGVSNILLGDDKLEDVIHQTDEPNLHVLTCGPTPPNPAELLHTRKFLELVEDLRGRYDKIIFDSSPCVAVTDPVVLGSITDGTLLVLRAEETSRDAAKQAMRTLRDSKVRVLGAILNTVDIQSRRYYGSYYYSRYSSYGGEGEQPKDKA